MKKLLLLKMSLVIALMGGASFNAWASSTTSSAGATDNSTAWNTWDAGFTKNYTLSGNGSYQFRFYTTNATEQEYYGWTLFVGNTINTTNVWDSWMNCRGGNATVWGTRDGANGSADVTNTYSTNNPTGSGITAAMNGAMVTLTVTRSSETIVASAVVTPASENPFNITWTYTYGVGDDTSANLYICFAVEKAYLNITSARTIAENYSEYQIMKENYETLTANADIKSTLESNGWSFNGRNGTDPTASCIQGTAINMSKYAKIQYPNIAGNRTQIWQFQDLNALTGDNWTLSFSAALSTPNTNSGIGLAIIGTSSSYSGTDIYCNNPFFKVYAKEVKSTAYTAAIGGADIDENTYTLASGTWYKYLIKVSSIDADAKTATIYVKITSYDEATTVLETTKTNVSTSSIGTLKGLVWLTPRANMPLLLDDVVLTKDISTAICADPTYTSTGASGISRKFTLACETANSTVYYSETELEAGADGWTEYTGEVITSATTLYAYAATASANSDVISITTGAGTAVQLVKPTISRSSYYSVTITADQSSLGFDVSPVPTIYYTYGGVATEYTGAITVSADETITAYAMLDGYTTSETASRAVALYPSVQIENAPENNTYSTSAALSGSTFTTAKATYDALIIDGNQWGKNVYVQTTNFNWRNGGSSNHWYINSTSSTWLCMKNMKAGEVVVCHVDYAASSLVNATYSEKYSYGNYFAYEVTEDGDVEIGLAKPNSKTMCYFYGIYAYSDNYVSKSISSAGWATYCSPYALDFSSSIDNLDDAYIVTGGENGVLAKTSVNGSTVPANTGLLLKGTAGTLTIPVVASSLTDVSDNILEGVTSATEIAAGTGWVLMASPSLGFYKNANAFTVGANTAYIPLSKLPEPSVNARGFFSLFGDETTSISEEYKVKSEELTTAPTYNLQGQRVAQPTKGMYIVNGKKVVIK